MSIVFTDNNGNILTFNGKPISIGLPSGYTQVSYIESDLNGVAASAGPYIDTGVIADANTQIDIKFSINNATSSINYCIYGASNGNSYSTGELALFWNYSSSYGGRILEPVCPQSNSISNVLYRPNFTADTVYTCSFNKTRMIFDGSSRSASWYSDYQGVRSLYLFATHRSSSIWSSGGLKLYHCKIYQSGSLIHDYIPAKNSSNVLGLYDLVSESFLTNSGGGRFITEGSSVSGGSSCCVSENTPINYYNGTTKLAKEVQVGDKLLGYNETAKEFEEVEVLQVRTPIRNSMIRVTLEDDSYIDITPDHPLYTENGWQAYDLEAARENYKNDIFTGITQLTIDSKLLYMDGTYKGIKRIEELVLNSDRVKVYTFDTTNGVDTYISNGLVSHNHYE